MTLPASQPPKVDLPIRIGAGMPTYLTAPYKVQRDMVMQDGFTGELTSGLRRRAPVQNGIWWLEPYYAGMIPVLVDIETGYTYSRFDAVLRNNPFAKKAIDILNQVSLKDSWPKDARYIHALRYSNPDTRDKITFAQSLIVIDLIIPDVAYIDRRKILERNFEQLGIRCEPVPETVYLVPRFHEAEVTQLWACLHLQNQEWESNPLYAGIVEKREASFYNHQKISAEQPSINWIAHTFDNLL